jgi:hypothetical protein
MTHGGDARAVWIRRLFLSCFRSYLAFDLSPDRRPVVLTGPNGAGKTNLLEAISLLAPGQGLRGARLDEFLHRGGPAERADAAEPAWAVSLELETAGGRRTLGTGLDRAADGRERRTVKIDGETQRGQAPLGEIFRLVWLTPQMDGWSAPTIPPMRAGDMRTTMPSGNGPASSERASTTPPGSSRSRMPWPVMASPWRRRGVSWLRA